MPLQNRGPDKEGVVTRKEVYYIKAEKIPKAKALCHQPIKIHLNNKSIIHTRQKVFFRSPQHVMAEALPPHPHLRKIYAPTRMLLWDCRQYFPSSYCLAQAIIKIEACSDNKPVSLSLAADSISLIKSTGFQRSSTLRSWLSSPRRK